MGITANLKYAYRKAEKRIAVYALTGDEASIDDYISTMEAEGQNKDLMYDRETGELIRYQSGKDIFPDRVQLVKNKGRFYFDNSEHEDMLRLLGTNIPAMLAYTKEYNKSITMWGSPSNTVDASEEAQQEASEEAKAKK